MLTTIFLHRVRATSLVLACAFVAACTSSEPADAPSNPATDSYAASLGIDIAEFTRVNEDVYVRDITVGEGALAETGRTLRVTYTGWLPNGQQFESNAGGSPFQFVLGAADVIRGWDQGIVGMRAGGKRRLLIGSRAGYGRTGRGSIPPNSTMIFDVEIVSVQ
jgi:FKBP-type peptidyl-prolyl cis-trans isomerase FkpA